MGFTEKLKIADLTQFISHQIIHDKELSHFDQNIQMKTSVFEESLNYCI